MVHDEVAELMRSIEPRAGPVPRPDRIPVVHVTCPPKGSPRKLAMEFARFLGLPLPTRANVTDIADASARSSSTPAPTWF
jgi:hypothetical protein